MEGVNLGPPPPLLPPANKLPTGNTELKFNPIQGSLYTLEVVCADQQGNKALAAYPKIYDMLKTDKDPKAKERLDTLVYLSLEKHPPLMEVVLGKPHHVWLLWYMELLPRLFTNDRGTDRQIVEHSRDLVEGTFHPTININPTW